MPGNLDIVRGMVDAWNRRDLDAILALTHPQAEFVNAPTAVEPGTRRGLDAVTAVLRTQWDTLVDGRLDVEELHELGDHVVLLARLSQRLAGSDSRIEDGFLASYGLRAGKVVRVEILALGARDARRTMAALGIGK